MSMKVSLLVAMKCRNEIYLERNGLQQTRYMTIADLGCTKP